MWHWDEHAVVPWRSILFGTHILGPTCAQHAYIMHQLHRGLTP